MTAYHSLGEVESCYYLARQTLFNWVLRNHVPLVLTFSFSSHARLSVSHALDINVCKPLENKMMTAGWRDGSAVTVSVPPTEDLC